MNFKECKTKYPVGMIMGNFMLNFDFPITKEELKNRLRSSFFYPELFYFYNNETKKFHRADFLYKDVEGYITINGSDFRPFSSDEMGIHYLDIPTNEDFIKINCNWDEFITKVDKAWLELHPDQKPIRTLEDLEKIEKYDF